MNIRSLTRGDGAVIGAAVLLLIASFLPFFTYKAFNISGGTSDKSVNTWDSSMFPILPSVTLAALVAAGLLVAARSQPAGRQLAGLTLEQWGTALAIFAGWSALWSVFSSVAPNAGDGVSRARGLG